MKRITAIILTTLLFLFCFAVGVSAEEGYKESGESTTEELPYSAAEDGGEADNVFVILFDTFSDYLPEILGVLSFTVSLVLAFFYKRGLIPIVKASIGKLSGIVGEVNESSRVATEATLTSKEEIDTKLASLESIIGELRDNFTMLDKSLREAEDKALDRAKISLVLSTQVDMLYNIFMSSSIPQFQKELVGESVSIMKEAIRENEDGKPEA